MRADILMRGDGERRGGGFRRGDGHRIMGLHACTSVVDPGYGVAESGNVSGHAGDAQPCVLSIMENIHPRRLFYKSLSYAES
jgi:hypothetical protein